MKFGAVLPFAALAGAFVVPDERILSSLLAEDKHDESSWFDKLPSKESVISSFDDAVQSVSSRINSAIHTAEQKIHDLGQTIGDEIDSLDLFHRPGHEDPDSTIYEIISKSNYTKKFASFVDKFDDIVELLNSTKANYTLFVPTDDVFEHIPHHDKDHKPSKEWFKEFIQYHIGAGSYPALKVIHAQTIPTVHKEKWLGDEPQRLRVSVGFGGIRLNFLSKVTYANFGAKNGFIHAIDHVLLPPTFIGAELGFFPEHFSTLLLAYAKTDFVKFIHGVNTVGSTVFAPTNKAFERLGPRANAFLFNTEKGKGYLRALLKYQIVANVTLYSDAQYGSPDTATEASDHTHVILPTLLDKKLVSVDIYRWGSFVTITVNGAAKVVARDTPGKNGVLQIVDSIPIPPHREGEGKEYNGGEIEVEDLIQRLGDYTESDDEVLSGEL